jgi:hypothetical protein
MATSIGWAIASLMIISGFQFGGSSNRNAGSSTDSITLVGTLLLAVGAAGIAVLIRTNEHQLTSHLLRYARATINSLVGLAFLIVLALAFAGPEVLKVSFFAAGVLAVVGAVVLTLPQLPPAFDRMQRVMVKIRKVFREP